MLRQLRDTALGAAEGDLFAKGQSGMLPNSVRVIHNRGNLACCPDLKVSHYFLGDFVVAPVPDALPSLIVRRGGVRARRCGGLFE
jgi:hypothetical protein